MPEYIIEPPDVLSIEAINYVPRWPYYLRPMDVVTISSSGLSEEFGRAMPQGDWRQRFIVGSFGSRTARFRRLLWVRSARPGHLARGAFRQLVQGVGLVDRMQVVATLFLADEVHVD